MLLMIVDEAEVRRRDVTLVTVCSDITSQRRVSTPVPMSLTVPYHVEGPWSFSSFGQIGTRFPHPSPVTLAPLDTDTPSPTGRPRYLYSSVYVGEGLRPDHPYLGPPGHETWTLHSLTQYM